MSENVVSALAQGVASGAGGPVGISRLVRILPVVSHSPALIAVPPRSMPRATVITNSFGNGDMHRLHRTPAADLVFLDPPFPMVESQPAKIVGLLDTLAERLEPVATVFLRTPSALDPLSCHAFELVDQREVGVNRIELWRLPES